MKQLRLTIVALFGLSFAASAVSGSCLAATALWSDGQNSSVGSTVPGAPGHIVRNANECAPDQADAVWGGHGNLLGYSCYNNPNGS